MSQLISRSTTNPDGFLPLELDYIPDNLREKARFELFEDEETRVQSLKVLRSMLKNEPGLHWPDDDITLLAFLRSRKFDVKRAFNLIKTTFTVMGKHDELYYDFNFADVKRAAEANGIGFFPYRDSEGSVIFVINSLCWDPRLFTMADVMRALTCCLIYASLSPATQIAGVKVLINLEGLTLKHIPHLSPTYLWLLMEAIQNSFPGRFPAVHFVNENSLFSYIWPIVKQFITKKMRERFHFHGKDMKKLHKYIPPNILPAEYGGELPPFDNTEWREMLERKADYLSYVFSHGYQKYKDRARQKKNTLLKYQPRDVHET